jgi:hypothetical protein
MTNTNREEWGGLTEALRDCAADLDKRPPTLLPYKSTLADCCYRAATTIENQGREIERYREALTKAATALQSFGAGLSAGDAQRALQSPTQAPLQEGE